MRTNFISTKMKIHLQTMNVKGCYCLFFDDVILGRSLRANEGHIGVNESILTVMGQIWTQMNAYFSVNEQQKMCVM